MEGEEGDGERKWRKGERKSKKKKKGRASQKREKMVLGGARETEKGRESLRHPSVSPGTFLCTRNDCTRSGSRIWEGGGEVSF